MHIPETLPVKFRSIFWGNAVFFCKLIPFMNYSGVESFEGLKEYMNKTKLKQIADALQWS